MPNAVVEGDKIYLRPVEIEDAPIIAGFLNDPVVTRTLNSHRPLPVFREAAAIEEICKNEMVVWMGIVEKQRERLIGTCNLRIGEFKDRKAEFGICIGVREEWGKGIGTEATRLMVKYGFETLNLHRIWLHVFESNPAGMKAYERAGFTKEGVLRGHTFRDGRYWDSIPMAILREEWEGLKG